MIFKFFLALNIASELISELRLEKAAICANSIHPLLCGLNTHMRYEYCVQLNTANRTNYA